MVTKSSFIIWSRSARVHLW